MSNRSHRHTLGWILLSAFVLNCIGLTASAQVPTTQATHEHTVQLLKQFLTHSRASYAARKELDKSLDAGDDALYEVLRCDNHAEAMLALKYLGARWPKSKPGQPNPLTGAEPFLMETCRQSTDASARYLALQELIMDDDYGKDVYALMFDPKVDANLRYNALQTESNRNSKSRTKAEVDALNAGLSKLADLWDLEEDPYAALITHSAIISLLRSVPMGQTLLDATPQLAVKPGLAVEMLLRLDPPGDVPSPASVPLTFLVKIVGIASTAPIGSMQAAEMFCVRDASHVQRGDFDGVMASEDPLIRRGAAYLLAYSNPWKIDETQRRNILLSLVSQPGYASDSTFCIRVGIAICDGDAAALEHYVASALTESGDRQKLAETALNIAGMADQVPPGEVRQPGYPTPGGRIVHALQDRNGFVSASSQRESTAYGMLRELGDRAGPVLRTQLQTADTLEPHQTPALIYPPQAPITWTAMPNTAAAATSVAGSQSYPTSTMGVGIFLGAVLLFAALYWAIQP